MGEPRTRYHEKKEKWRLFEDDVAELNSDRSKYSGISARPESYAFALKVNGKQIKSFQRLADIYEFKLKYEAENER